MLDEYSNEMASPIFSEKKNKNTHTKKKTNEKKNSKYHSSNEGAFINIHIFIFHHENIGCFYH